MRILIANRGEIARRILRTAHRMGYETVAAWADPDREAPFVAEATSAIRLGPAALADSYLSVDALLDAAARTGATAVHPGYGFLSENAAFAHAVEAAGLTWIGPHPRAIEQMGSKIEARRLAAAAGVPVIPGFDASQDPAALADAAREIGYPVMIKASAGGGGKGIRVVASPADFDTALRDAREESRRAFERALELEPERALSLAALADLAAEAGERDKALDLYDRAAEVDPDDPAPSLAAAELLQDARQTAAARERLEVLLARHPRETAAALALALILAEQGELDAALAFAKRAAWLGAPQAEETLSRIREQQAAAVGPRAASD